MDVECEHIARLLAEKNSNYKQGKKDGGDGPMQSCHQNAPS